MLYLLTRKNQKEIIWDCMDSCVVRSSTQAEAREIAATHRGDEGREVWLDRKQSTCEPLDLNGPNEMIAINYNNG